jgi:hypothetical protein
MQEGQGNPADHTAYADVYAEPDGTVVMRYHAGVALDTAAAALVAAAHVRAAAGQKRPILVDVRGMVSVDRGGREVAAGAAVVAATSRMALLVGNPVTRVLGNFFSRVTTPGYPTRLFTDEAAARAWLKEEPHDAR